MENTKQRIRETMLARRGAIPADQALAWSRAVHGHLWGWSVFVEAGLVCTYVSAKGNELDTLALLESLWARERPVAVPKVLPGRAMGWFLARGWDDLAPGPFGLREPRPGTEAVRPGAEAVCVTPGLAFDGEGRRIGFGGGYFDRFLSSFEGVAAGVFYACQRLDRLPEESHDVRLPWVVTEGGLEECGRGA